MFTFSSTTLQPSSFVFLAWIPISNKSTIRSFSFDDLCVILGWLPKWVGFAEKIDWGKFDPNANRIILINDHNFSRNGIEELLMRFAKIL